MVSGPSEKGTFLSVTSSAECADEDQRSRSNSTASSTISSIDDEWTALSQAGDNDEILLSVKDADIIAQVLSNIVQVPWQDELTAHSNENETLYCCLGISPSQFRRLMPSRRNARQSSSRMAILYAQIAMQYTLKQTDRFDDNNTSISLIVLIVDAIQKYNFAVFNNKQLKTGTALKYALEEGDRLVDTFTQARSRLSPELAQRVTIIRWHDICNETYNEYVQALQQHVTTNKQFAKLIDDLVQVFIQVRKPNGHFTEKQRLILREYVLNELPVLAHGIVYNGHHYSIIVHPILLSADVKNDKQRDVILHLLNYVRHSSELRSVLNLIEQVPMCEVYDIAMPVFKPSSILSPDETIPQESPVTKEMSSSTVENLSTENVVNINFTLFSIVSLIVNILLFKLPIITIVLGITFLATLSYFAYHKINAAGNWSNVIGTAYRFPFGDMPAIQASCDGHYLLNLCKKLGMPQVYRIWFGPAPALMLAHPEAVRQFWQQHDETSIERIVKLGWSLLLIMGEGMGFKAYHNRNRINRFFHACFGIKQVKHFEMNYEHQVDLVMQRLETRVTNSYGTLLDVAKQFQYLALDADVNMFLGTMSEKYLSQLHELVDELGVLLLATFDARYINIPILCWLLPDTYRLRSAIYAFRTKWDHLLHTIMDDYEREGNIEYDADDDSILVRYMRMQKDGRKSEITYEELSHTMIEGLLAPLDGVAATFANTLILLALNPEAQTKAREHIRDRLPSGIQQTVTLADLDGLNHLDHILCECQRLLPIFVFNVPELASCEMTVKNVTIPKDTLVMYDVQTLSRREDIWPEPLVFRPERFQTLNDKQRKALHGFGNGRSRRCLGEYFVRSLHKLLIARILLAYRLEPADDERDIDKLPRIRRPFIYVPHVMLKFIPIDD